MIECTAKNIWYKKRRKNKKKFFTSFLVVIIICTCVLYYRAAIIPQIYKVCIDYGKVYCTEATNQAVTLSLASSNYSDIITIEKNSLGDIVLMSANTQKVNDISRTIEKDSAQFLKNRLDKGIDIPLLAFSGINLISGYGKKINFNALIVSNVTCDFSSDFKAVGINQTLHSIYVEITSVIDLEIPLSNYKSEFSSTVLISEAIIVGKVPDTYLNGKLFS